MVFWKIATNQFLFVLRDTQVRIGQSTITDLLEQTKKQDERQRD